MFSLPLVVLSFALTGAPLSGGEPQTPSPPQPQLTGIQIYEKGKAALDRGDLPLARKCFEQLLKAKPDFELGRIQLALVAQAEREDAKIPRSLKVAKAQALSRIEWSGATLGDALSMVAKQLEKAGASEKLAVNLTGHLPEAVSNRSITMNVSKAPFDQVLEALGIAGEVRISYTTDGIAVSESREGRGEWDAGNPKLPAMSAAAKKIIIDRIAMKDASVVEALEFLQRKAAEVSGGTVRPIFAIRHDFVSRDGVTLDLRNVSLHDAVRSVCLVAEIEEKWYPWGAGIGTRQVAATATGPSRKEETPK